MKTNKGMVVYKENFLIKIRKFFINLFRKQEKEYNDVQEIISESTKEIAQQDKFLNEIKVDSNNEESVSDFLKQVKGNAEALKLLSIDRLKKLEQYYDGIIEQNEKQIKKLKANT